MRSCCGLCCFCLVFLSHHSISVVVVLALLSVSEDEIRRLGKRFRKLDTSVHVAVVVVVFMCLL